MRFALLFCLFFASPALALPRVMSLNMCADPYLLAIAAPEQIVALTRLTQNPALSPYGEAARRFAISDGGIEDILQRAPDIVIRNAFSDPFKQAFIKKHGIEVITLASANSYAQARHEIMRLGRAIKREPQAHAYLAALDEALTQTRNYNIRLLPLQRRNITNGAGHIIDDIITRAGAHNAARTAGAFAAINLEQILQMDVDFLLLNETSAHNIESGRGAEFLTHPALARAFPPEKRIYLGTNLSVCAGATTPLAVQALQKALDKISTQQHARKKQSAKTEQQ